MSDMLFLDEKFVVFLFPLLFKSYTPKSTVLSWDDGGLQRPSYVFSLAIWVLNSAWRGEAMSVSPLAMRHGDTKRLLCV